MRASILWNRKNGTQNFAVNFKTLPFDTNKEQKKKKNVNKE